MMPQRWRRPWIGSDCKNFAQSYPRELSGGMKMRASIARALVTEPQLILMDEPFAALDEITRFKLNNDLLALWQALGRTVIFVTHSVFELVYLSQRIVVMTPRPGRVFTQIAIDAPYPRDEHFRTSPEYAGFCRRVARALGEAMAGARHERACSPRRLAGHRTCSRGFLLGSVGARVRDPAVCVTKSRTRTGDAWSPMQALLWRSLLVTLTLTFEGFLLAAELAASCWQSHSTNGDWSNIHFIHMPSFSRSHRSSLSRRFC